MVESSIKKTSNRIHWIDITKGILIILMVLGHISNVSGKHGIPNGDLLKCIFFNSIWSCFFMQGFFILTGYTTNFEKDARTYLVSSIKTLVVPWLSFSLITRVLGWIIWGGGFYEEIDGTKYFCLIEDYWFIQALFFAKICYYFIRKYLHSDWLRLSILLLFTLAGFYSISYYHSFGFDHPYHMNNYLHYKDFLCMTAFLWVGDFMKRKNMLQKLLQGKWFIVVLLTYISAHAIRLIARIKGFEVMELSPVVLSHGGNITSISQIPAYFFYAILGSLSCFGIANLINQNRLLEYFGKNSLVVYCIHFLLLDIYIPLLSKFLNPVGMINSMFFTLIILVLCLISCVPIIKLLSYKPFNFLIGKYGK